MTVEDTSYLTQPMTITRELYEAELNDAYARGRKDERKRQRDKVTDSLTSSRHDTVERYLKATGWTVTAVKSSGMEWTDPRTSFRVGLTNKITAKSWANLIRGLAGYYNKSEQQIQADILSYGKKRREDV